MRIGEIRTPHGLVKLEILEANARIERVLIYAYPEDALPTRLKCGKVVLPLDLAPPGRGESSAWPSPRLS